MDPVKSHRKRKDQVFFLFLDCLCTRECIIGRSFFLFCEWDLSAPTLILTLIRGEICQNLTRNQCQHRSSVFCSTFEHILLLFLYKVQEVWYTDRPRSPKKSHVCFFYVMGLWPEWRPETVLENSTTPNYMVAWPFESAWILTPYSKRVILAFWRLFCGFHWWRVTTGYESSLSEAWGNVQGSGC